MALAPRRAVQFVKTTVLGGVVVILPGAVVVFLLGEVFGAIRAAARPVTEWLSIGVLPGVLIEGAILLGACFLLGLALRLEAGARVWRWIERSLLERLPLYASVRSLGQSLTGQEGGLAPALVEMQGALVPALVVEAHADGRLTVFVPAVPTPTLGFLYIVDAARVHRLAVPLSAVITCVTEWGRGSKALVDALPRR